MANTGVNTDYASKMPDFGDNADIQDAIRKYHYGSQSHANANESAFLSPSGFGDPEYGIVGKLKWIKDQIDNMNSASASGSIFNSIINAKGDLIVGTADNTPARFGVGSNGFVLKADSTTSSGLRWANLDESHLNLNPGSQTLVGNLTLSKASAVMKVSSTSGGAVLDINAGAGQNKSLFFQTGDSDRWRIASSSAVESSTATGSDFQIARYNNSGALIEEAFAIARDTGKITVTQSLESLDFETGYISIPDANNELQVSVANGYVNLARVIAGRSGSGYGTIGEGYKTTSTSNVYQYLQTSEYATQIDFASGQIKFKTAPNTGTAGNTVSFTTQMTVADGSVTVNASTATLPSDTAIGSVDSTEISYLNGVTSSIQTQINTKAPSSSPTLSNPTLTGTVTVAAPDRDSNTTVAASTAFVSSKFAASAGTADSAGVTNWNNLVSAPGVQKYLMLGNATNGPTPGASNYFYSLNFEYASSGGSGNTTQLAIPYSVDSDYGLAVRSRYSGSWSSWQRFTTKTYADNQLATKMPLAGGTFSGAVTFSSYAYFNYPAHFYNYATTHNAGISTTTMSASGAVSGAQGHFGSGSGNGIWTNYIHSSAWGDIIMETNGGGLVVKNNVGTLTPIACAYPSSNDHAATMYYVTAAMYDHLVNYHGSERSLKDKIKSLSVNEKSSFSSLSPKSFIFKPTGEERLGFIAEEVEAAGLRVTEIEVPNKDEDAPKEYVKTLDPMDLIAVLWAKVEEQEERLAALEKKA